MERFWSKVDRSNECWFWLAYKDKHGYGQFRLNGKTAYAHRVSYEWHKGDIPPNKSIDHICRNPSCVNPQHLEVVTQLENVHRGVALKGTRTYCVNGHLRAKEGKAHRSCKRCINDRSKAWRKDNKERRTAYQIEYRARKKAEQQ